MAQPRPDRESRLRLPAALTASRVWPDLPNEKWDAQKRIEKKLPFPWKPKTWYRLKITATVKNGKGIVKGKVWQRGTPEPDKWLLEIEDPSPNTEGAPLIYGFPNGVINAQSPGPDIFYSYVKITPNKR